MIKIFSYSNQSFGAFVLVGLLFFCSCGKEPLIAQQPLPSQPVTTYSIYDFKATVTLTPAPNTLYYEVFVSSNNEYAHKVKRILPSDIKNGSYSFVFHLEPVICEGKVTTDTRLQLKGIVQEWRPNNNIWAIPDNAIKIERCISRN